MRTMPFAQGVIVFVHSDAFRPLQSAAVREFYGQARQSLGQLPPNYGDSNKPSFKIVSNHKLKRILNYEFVYDDLMTLISPTQQFAFENKHRFMSML